MLQYRKIYCNGDQSMITNNNKKIDKNNTQSKKKPIVEHVIRSREPVKSKSRPSKDGKK